MFHNSNDSKSHLSRNIFPHKREDLATNSSPYVELTCYKSIELTDGIKVERITEMREGCSVKKSKEEPKTNKESEINKISDLATEWFKYRKSINKPVTRNKK